MIIHKFTQTNHYFFMFLFAYTFVMKYNDREVGACRLMKTRVQIQSNPFVADADEIEEIVKMHLNASDIKLTSVEELNIYYKPYDGSIYYVAKLTNGQELKNTQPLFI